MRYCSGMGSAKNGTKSSIALMQSNNPLSGASSLVQVYRGASAKSKIVYSSCGAGPQGSRHRSHFCVNALRRQVGRDRKQRTPFLQNRTLIFDVQTVNLRGDLIRINTEPNEIQLSTSQYRLSCSHPKTFLYCDRRRSLYGCRSRRSRILRSGCLPTSLSC